MLKGCVCFFFFLLLTAAVAAQDVNPRPDTSETVILRDGDKVRPEETVEMLLDSVNVLYRKDKPKFYPVPKKALMYSLLTPGLAGGQFYNRDYWKMPLVITGYGVSTYFIVQNVRGYNGLTKAYKSFYYLDRENDGDLYGQRNPNVKEVSAELVWDKRTRSLNFDQVKRAKDYYRRMRDWSFFAAVAVYALAAIETNVAAHLKTFDLSDDLSLRIEPSLRHSSLNAMASGTVPGGMVPGVRLVVSVK